MLVCGHCSHVFSNVNTLITHLKKNCNNLCSTFLSGDGYRCGQGCFEKFDSLNTLRTHIKRTHVSQSGYNDNTESGIVSEPVVDQDSANRDDCVDTVNSYAHNSDKELHTPNSSEENPRTDCDLTVEHADSSSKNAMTIATALLVSSLLADPLVPRKTVQMFVTSMSSYLHRTMAFALESWFSKVWQEEECARCKPDIDELMLTIKESVLDFSSEYKRNKYFVNLGTYIEPEEYFTTTEPRDEFVGEKRKQVLGTGQFIPLRFVLQKFLTIPGVLKSIDEYVEFCLRSKVIANVVRSSIWLNKLQASDNNEKIFPLFIYFDDYETGNPLGSHAGIHKLGAVYASIACLPPNLASRLKYIFLFALFYSADRTLKDGNFNCLHKVIEELNFLSRTGIDLNVPGYYDGRVKFQLVSLIGDNLGLHSILGFVESFTANYPCRICRAHKSMTKSMCVEDVSLLRNETNYTVDLNTQSTSETGIKEKSIWMQVDGFDMFKQNSVDIMHDILEGVARYTMKEVIKGLLLKKYFCLEDLNNRVVSFNYGPDSHCKPPQLVLENGKTVKWKMSAMETSNFIRYFSCFVSHKVPFENEHWQLYLLLRKIYDLSMTESVYPEICDEIRDTVSQFNDLYLLLSGSELKPKFHHLLHYPSVMEKLGPLSNLWSMRYESKHRISKICARASSNRINLPKTLAIKHQLQLNYLFLKNEIDDYVEHSSSSNKELGVDIFNILSRHFHIASDSKVFTVNFITLNGLRYVTKQVLTLEVNGNTGEPDFIEISDIYYNENTKDVYFSVYNLENKFYDPHVNAYCVEKTSILKYVSFDSIGFLKPNNLTMLPPYNWWYVIVRHSLH